MKPTVPATAPTHLTTDRDERLKHLPDTARAAFQKFQVEGNPAALDPVIFAILEDFIPHTPATPMSELPPTSRLIEDLGFDSLAITEVVFFTEDLFGIAISNEEIIQVRTLEDLRGFIFRKVTPAPGR
ncbi:MAG TPA: acyl carrier protein [Lacunisphaera sp.]|jgi:acyl carrier protein